MRHLRDIVGNTSTGRQGVQMSQFMQWSKTQATEMHTLVQAEVKSTEEDQRKAKATELGKQMTWMKWDLPQRKLTWKEL